MGDGWLYENSSPIMGFDSKLTGTTNWADTAGSDVVVVTAGIARKPGMSRDDLLSTNAKIVGDVAAQIRDTSPQAVVIVVSNPLDAMVQRTFQVTGFPAARDRKSTCLNSSHVSESRMPSSA